jgi:hypothetical protein
MKAEKGGEGFVKRKFYRSLYSIIIRWMVTIDHGHTCYVSQIISGIYILMLSKIFGPVRSLIHALLLWKEYYLGFENIPASPKLIFYAKTQISQNSKKL